jgi:trans-aconitate methyltransferase
MMDNTVSTTRWNTGLYDDKHSFVWKHGAALLDLLAPQAGERILDLGCGTGHLTAKIAEAGAEVVGIDASSEMAAEARRLYPNIRFEIADARDFAFDQPFDAVFSNAVLHWVNEPEKAIACVQRTLKPGGRFVAEFGGRGNVKIIMSALDAASRVVGLGAWKHPWYYPGISEYASLLEQRGLEVTHAFLFDRPTPLEGEQGLRDWVKMFCGSLLGRVPPADHERFFRHVEEVVRPTLYRDGQWSADYRRLRIVARKTDDLET